MKLRACVLDDDDSIRTLVSIVLEMRGYKVDAYEDPTQCQLPVRKLYKKNGAKPLYDVIISDVNMPGMTGFEFLGQLDQRGLAVDNIAMMSGYWHPALLKQAEEAGYQIFQKPFDVDDMERWLDKISTSAKNFISSLFAAIFYQRDYILQILNAIFLPVH